MVIVFNRQVKNSQIHWSAQQDNFAFNAFIQHAIKIILKVECKVPADFQHVSKLPSFYIEYLCITFVIAFHWNTTSLNEGIIAVMLHVCNLRG